MYSRHEVCEECILKKNLLKDMYFTNVIKLFICIISSFSNLEIETLNKIKKDLILILKRGVIDEIRGILFYLKKEI